MTDPSTPSSPGPSGTPPTGSRPPLGAGPSARAPPPPPGYYPSYPPPPRRQSVLGRMLMGMLGTLLLVSILANLYMFQLVSSMISGPTEEPYAAGDAAQRIVIIPIRGTIDDSTARFVHAALADLRANKPKAIVLRVESGGGGVQASDLIWHEITEFKKETKIPIVASFGSLAASGGYYISAPSDYIFAERTTLTGSIGVIAMAFTYQDLLTKVGVTPEVIHATKATRKDVLSPYRAWNDGDRSELRTILDEAYDNFVSVVADGRSSKLKPDEVAALANGLPYTAKEALNNKLIDEIGYLDAAINKAKALAGLTNASVMVATISPARKLNLLNLISSTNAPQPQSITGEQIRRWAAELSQPRLEYSITPQ